MSRAPMALGRWGGRWADDRQAAFQRSFMKSKLGQKLAQTKVGEKLGLERLATHGVALRTIPAAWKARAGRKEKERMAESAAVAEDILNRAMFLTPDKSDRTRLARGARVKEAKSEIEAGSTETSVMLEQLKLKLDKTGRVKKGMEHEAEAILQIMMKNHDLNEPILDKDIALMSSFNGTKPNNQWQAEVIDENGDLVTKTGREAVMVYNAHNAKTLLRGMFGELEGARIASQLEDIGLEHKDGGMKGLAIARAGGGFKFTDDDDQIGMAAGNAGKREPQALVRSGSRQDLLAEMRDQNGMAAFPVLHKTGQALVPIYGSAWSMQPKRILPESRDTYLGNLDAFMAYINSMGPEQEAEKREILGGLSAMIGTVEGYKDLKDTAGNKMKGEALVRHYMEREVINNKSLHNMRAAIFYNRMQDDIKNVIGAGINPTTGKPYTPKERKKLYEEYGAKIRQGKNPFTEEDSADAAKVRDMLVKMRQGAIGTPGPQPEISTEPAASSGTPPAEEEESGD